MMGIESSQARFNSLSPALQGAISNHPLVAQHGMPANMALDLMAMSQRKGENIGDTVSRHIFGGNSPAPPVPASSGTFTAAGPRLRPESVATAAGPRRGIAAA